MNFNVVHNNFNVLNLQPSILFYSEALGLKEQNRVVSDDGSFILVYMGSDNYSFQIELTWLRDRQEPYNLGDNESHLAFTTSDFDGAFHKHNEMNCVCYVNDKMGIYFISDPDGYWIEIIPSI